MKNKKSSNTKRNLPPDEPHPQFKTYTLRNFKNLPQMEKLSGKQKFEIEVVGHVFPFKTNNFVVENLIDWDRFPDDPLFELTFPKKQMLIPSHYEKMARVLRNESDKKAIRETANQIRMELTPHPAGQMEYNIPYLEDKKLVGMQHKYKETVLFFPSQGQTCFAYCTFCFRWPQFIGIQDLKFAMRETELLVGYVRRHTEISDILFTGGDPLIMNTNVLAPYIRVPLQANLPNLKTIRIGTRALSYWPYRFLTDSDAKDLLGLFREVGQAGKHLAIMAHFNHPRELQNEKVQEAIKRIRETGALIRTQSPLLSHINDQPKLWVEMWKEQVKLGCVPYYMFVVRDTGAQHYFGVPLVRAWKIFRKAYQKVSGLARTVRGPSMSALPGKVHILGVNEIKGEKVFILQFLQGRNPDWVRRPFFAKYDEKAIWFDELKPAFGGHKFFFEEHQNS